MNNRRIHHIVRVSIFAIFLCVLYRLIDLNILKEALQQIRIEIVLVAIFFYFFTIAIRALRLQIILNNREKHIELKDAYIITLIGIALNIVIPATLGDIGRSYYGYKMYGIKEEMLSTTIVDKLFALGSLFLLGAISGSITGHYLLGLMSLGSAVLTCTPLVYPQLIPWNLLNRMLRRFGKSLKQEKLAAVFHVSSKALVMGISITGWLCTCFYFYILCFAFSVDVSLGYIIVIMPIVTIVRLFPFTVNALGPTEVAVAYFFNLVGINSTLAVLISLCSNLISSIIPGLIGVVIIISYGHGNKNQKTEGKNPERIQ